MTTEDGIEIVGDWYPSDGARFAMLVHMMPATKESWRDFASALVRAGYSALAIDLRGHGDSTAAGSLNYRTFSNREHRESIRDLRAAFEWLASRGATPETTIAIGASIGANLALQFEAERSLPLAIALSPGLEYHGVTTDPAVRSLGDGQRAVLVASDDDPESFESVRALHDANPGRTELMERRGAGHGTRMFDNDPALMEELLGRV